MAVHRISDRAEKALQDLVKTTGKKPSEILSELVVAYVQGLTFNGEKK